MSNRKYRMKIIFDATHLYYLTQYLPVYRRLQERGAECHFCFYREHGMQQAIDTVVSQEGLKAHWVENRAGAARLYREMSPHWVIFGNTFPDLDKLAPATKTAQLYHGIGMKSDVYRPGLMEMDIRFVEGPHYTEILERMYPGRPMLEVGYAKLDPLFGPPDRRPRLDLAGAGLDENKRTILYAPTYYPSSIELMADDWPGQFREYNLIVKPHPFTLSKEKYRRQREKLTRWSRAPNVHFPEPDAFNLLPYMGCADLMISDASSALFEFAALDKPVVWCDFLKVRWSYRGPLRFRLRKRMDDTIYQYSDISAHARSYQELKAVVEAELANPRRYAEKRRRHTRRLIGKTDGKVSERIADHLLAQRTEP